MKLQLTRDEVEKIILSWAEEEMPGRFNTLVFKSYGNEVDLIFEKPKKIEEEKGGISVQEK